MTIVPESFQRSLASRIPPPASRLITRFAPSPTGELHLGHVAHALWVWGVASVCDATVVIRMEDHDRTRCRSEYAQSILDDLAWLGFVPTQSSVDRQSDHPERYAAAAKALAETVGVYDCHCTRSMMGEPDEEGERRHPDQCGKDADAVARRRGGRGAEVTLSTAKGRDLSEIGIGVLRVKLPDRDANWTDVLTGPATENPWHRFGDTAIRDAMGHWTYQFCVVIDDLHDGVNLIVRGEDLRSSTGRQVLLAEMLGRTEPIVTVHHPLLLAADGKKLSKRDQSETVRAMRKRGMSAAEIVGRARRGAGHG